MIQENSTQRLIAKVLRTVLHRETFHSFADLKPALRLELRRLRIRYQPADIDDAISLVCTSVRMVPAFKSRPQPAILDPAPPLHRVEATRIYAALMARFHAEPRR